MEEAFATLSDLALRAVYDAALEAGKPPPDPARPASGTGVAPTGQPGPPPNATGYEPLITGYCAFCKTPHRRGSGLAEDAQCAECESPLSPPTITGFEQAGRTLERMHGDDPLAYYIYWPGRRLPGRMHDLSPSGMRLSVEHPVGPGQVIKIDAPRVQATGEIAHARAQADYTEVGLKFLSVQFTRQQGTFLSTSV